MPYSRSSPSESPISRSRQWPSAKGACWGLVVDVEVLVRASADIGVKPHPREGRRKATLSATGVSIGAFDVDVLLRAERASVLCTDDANCDVTVGVTRLTCELSDDADPTLTLVSWPPVSTSAARVAVVRRRIGGRRDFGEGVKRASLADSIFGRVSFHCIESYVHVGRVEALCHKIETSGELARGFDNSFLHADCSRCWI